jgi:hypothetical protein
MVRISHEIVRPNLTDGYQRMPPENAPAAVFMRAFVDQFAPSPSCR